MYLYVYDTYTGGSDRRQKSENLMRSCAEKYIIEEKVPSECISGEILRTPKGKPYFKEIPVEFSVSHTGTLWVCLMGKETVGVDVQQMRRCRYDRIADRYYTQDEQEYVKQMGEEGFFQIWVRKEAYAKYTGEGLTEAMKEFSTLKDGGVSFVDFDIKAGVKGSCCMKEKCELWIRKIV